MAEAVQVASSQTDGSVGVASVRRPALALPGSALGALHAVMLLIPAFWAFGYLLPPLNHDAALILDVSSRWLDGARLYVDVIDVNPPLVFVLSAIPELAARIFGVADGPTMFVVMVLGLIAASLALTRSILLFAGSLFGPVSGFLLLPLLAFLLVVYPDDMFGQREHLMLAASMPYLSAAGCRAAGVEVPPRLLRAAMLLAGFGFALKPYFLLAPALIELRLLLARRGADLLRPVWWGLAVGPASQLLLLLFVTPEYLADVVPMAFRQYAEQGDAMWAVAMGGTILATAIAWAAAAALAAVTPGMPFQKVLTLYVLGGIVAAVAQAKGWPYQSLPAVAGCMLLVATTLAAVAERRLVRMRRTGPVVGLAGAVLLALCYNGAVVQQSFLPQRNYAESETRHLLDIVRRYALDDRVLIISPGVQPHFPMVNYARIRLTGRFESMWLLQGVYGTCGRHDTYNAAEWMSADERRIFNGLSADFARDRPSLVIVDREAGIPECGGVAFDYLEYFGRNPDFAATLAGYEEIAGFGRYLIFRRSVEATAIEE